MSGKALLILGRSSTLLSRMLNHASRLMAWKYISVRIGPVVMEDLICTWQQEKQEKILGTHRSILAPQSIAPMMIQTHKSRLMVFRSSFLIVIGPINLFALEGMAKLTSGSQHEIPGRQSGVNL
jgi:hypothetical protein